MASLLKWRRIKIPFLKRNGNEGALATIPPSLPSVLTDETTKQRHSELVSVPHAAGSWLSKAAQHCGMRDGVLKKFQHDVIYTFIHRSDGFETHRYDFPMSKIYPELHPNFTLPAPILLQSDH